MLGSTPITAVLGSGVDNRDHAAVRTFIRAACDSGLALMLIHPDSKVPADMRTPAMRRNDDKAARAAAQDAGRRDFASVKSASGLALASTDKTVVLKYLDHYIRTLSTWHDADAVHCKACGTILQIPDEGS